jgi:hypothetical protein
LGESLEDPLAEGTSEEQAKLDKIRAAFLRLPDTEIQRFEVQLEERILEGTTAAEKLVLAWQQRQQELQDVMKNLLKPAEYMGNITHQLQQPFRLFQLSHRVALLEELEDLISDLDNARDFHTIGGWPVLVSLLHESYPSVIRQRAAQCVGSAIKHNEEYQSWLLEPVTITLEVYHTLALDGEEAKKEKEMDIESTPAIIKTFSTTAFSLLLDILGLPISTIISAEPDNLVEAWEHWQLQKSTWYALSAGLRGNVDLQTVYFQLHPTTTTTTTTSGDSSSIGNSSGQTSIFFQRIVDLSELYIHAVSHTPHTHILSAESFHFLHYEIIRKIWSLVYDLVEEFHYLQQELAQIAVAAARTNLSSINRQDSSHHNNHNDSQHSLTVEITKNNQIIEQIVTSLQQVRLFSSVFLQEEYYILATSVLRNALQEVEKLTQTTSQSSDSDLQHNKLLLIHQSIAQNILSYFHSLFTADQLYYQQLPLPVQEIQSVQLPSTHSHSQWQEELYDIVSRLLSSQSDNIIVEENATVSEAEEEKE